MEHKIRFVLDVLRQHNSNIGDYVTHTTTNEFDYAVKLTNGRIIVKLEATQDVPNILPAHFNYMLSTFKLDQ